MKAVVPHATFARALRAVIPFTAPAKDAEVRFKSVSLQVVEETLLVRATNRFMLIDVRMETRRMSAPAGSRAAQKLWEASRPEAGSFMLTKLDASRLASMLLVPRQYVADDAKITLSTHQAALTVESMEKVDGSLQPALSAEFERAQSVGAFPDMTMITDNWKQSSTGHLALSPRFLGKALAAQRALGSRNMPLQLSFSGTQKPVHIQLTPDARVWIMPVKIPKKDEHATDYDEYDDRKQWERWI